MRTIFETDMDSVWLEDDGSVHWTWENGADHGEEHFPNLKAAFDYTEGCREDIAEAIREVMEEGPCTLEKLFVCDQLPNHWVGEDGNGELWIFPVAPLAPEAWERREPYKGHRQALKPALPENIIKFYRG